LQNKKRDGELTTVKQQGSGLQIIEFMLGWRDNSKWLFIAEDGKNDVTDLVHDRPQSNHLGLGLAFGEVIIS